MKGVGVHVPFSPPDIRQEDIDAVVDVLKSGWITSGPVGAQFAQALTEYCDAAGTVLVNSCTAGLELALVALGIGPGDEVIVPAYTYTASASIVHHVGATIVMVDVAPGSYFVDSSTWENAITDRTKAIIAVDIAGVMNDTSAIYRAIENRKDVFQPNGSLQEELGRVALIIDAAHSLGAVRDGAISGSVADLTAFSFHAVKNLTTGEGGALCWSKNLPVDHADFERTLRILCLHGQDKSALEKMNAAAWEYDVLSPAFKWNLADIMAALGHSQLKRYPEIIERRHEIIGHYDEIFADTPTTSLAHVGDGFRSSGHLYLLTLTGYSVEQRNAFIDDMYEAGVSCNVHYKPLPELTAYQNLGFSSADYPNALAQYSSEVTLPLHTCLTDEQVEYVASTARDLILT